ncbi:flavin reductase, partial [Micromonospora sp. NPDC049089]|uniref:flavin reductase n=1 Tax=Micromonospora sp. NPDC049089 TaxID=3155496 RepID=UPI0034119731
MTTHGPVLPIWSCAGCDAPWPCRTRQRELRAEFDDAPISLALYLGAQLVRASDGADRLGAGLPGGRRRRAGRPGAHAG